VQRYAEVVLNYAEALAQTEANNSLEVLNMIPANAEQRYTKKQPLKTYCRKEEKSWPWKVIAFSTSYEMRKIYSK
jgi:hypothetical protein